MSDSALTLPDNVRCNGRSDLHPGRALLHFTDLENGGDFSVREDKATTETIAEALADHRARWETPEQLFV
jgi:hypothetical protein